MPRRLPPLNSLKSFEAAGRLLSFTRAANELSVTQAAVSHQIKVIEDFLGLSLCHTGRQYAPYRTGPARWTRDTRYFVGRQS